MMRLGASQGGKAGGPAPRYPWEVAGHLTKERWEDGRESDDKEARVGGGRGKEGWPAEEEERERSVGRHPARSMAVSGPTGSGPGGRIPDEGVRGERGICPEISGGSREALSDADRRAPATGATSPFEYVSNRPHSPPCVISEHPWRWRPSHAPRERTRYESNGGASYVNDVGSQRGGDGQRVSPWGS
jgi:hypothetical protein